MVQILKSTGKTMVDVIMHLLDLKFNVCFFYVGCGCVFMFVKQNIVGRPTSTSTTSSTVLTWFVSFHPHLFIQFLKYFSAAPLDLWDLSSTTRD